MQGQAQKTAGKKPEFYPQHLDWFASNGTDVKTALSSAWRHEKSAEKYENILLRRSLKASHAEMDGYLGECRLAGRNYFELAKRLTELRAKFLSDPRNAGFTPEKYDSIVSGFRKKAEKLQKDTWVFEKEYAKKYGPREEYRTHLVVRDVARQIRTEMEQRAQEDRSEARNLSIAFARETREKYERKLSEGEAALASSGVSGYKRGYERAGKKYIEIAALRREPADQYHRGERKIREVHEPAAIAQRKAPSGERGIALGEAAIVPKKAPSAIARAQAEVDRVKRERAEHKKMMESLSGTKRLRAAEELAGLNKELYQARRKRDSFLRG